MLLPQNSLGSSAKQLQWRRCHPASKASCRLQATLLPGSASAVCNHALGFSRRPCLTCKPSAATSSSINRSVVRASSQKGHSGSSTGDDAASDNPGATAAESKAPGQHLQSKEEQDPVSTRSLPEAARAAADADSQALSSSSSSSSSSSRTGHATDDMPGVSQDEEDEEDEEESNRLLAKMAKMLEDMYEDEDEEDEEDEESEQRLLKVLESQEVESAVDSLAEAMLKCGIQGSTAVGLGWLLTVPVIDSFRWNPEDVQTGLLWAIPAFAMGLICTALPVTNNPQLVKQAAAAAPSAASLPGAPDTGATVCDADGDAVASSGANSSSSSSSSDSTGDGNSQFNSAERASATTPDSSSGSSGSSSKGVWGLELFDDLRRMKTNAKLSEAMPLKVTIGDDESYDTRQMDDLSWPTALQALRYMQEAYLQPWSLRTPTPKSWAIRCTAQLLKRLSVEVFWRGLVATGLATLIYSTWATAGTSQDSPLFYARLFGLLTPQSSLAVAAGLLVVGLLPFIAASAWPATLYTRLSSMNVEVVGRLTENDWLARVVPATTAAAAARSSSLKLDVSSYWGQSFGKMKEQDQAASSSGDTNSSSSKAKANTQQQQQPPLRQQLEERFNKVLLSVAEFKSSSRAADAQAGLQLTSREQQGAELAAEILDLVEASAAAKAAAVAATNASWAAKTAGLPGNKLAAALETVVGELNHDRQRRLLVLHVTGDNDDDSDSDDEDKDEAPAGTGASSSSSRSRSAGEAGAQSSSSVTSSQRKDGSSRTKDESSQVKDESPQGWRDEITESVSPMVKAFEELITTSNKKKKKQQQQEEDDGAKEQPSSQSEQHSSSSSSSSSSSADGSSSSSSQGASQQQQQHDPSASNPDPNSDSDKDEEAVDLEAFKEMFRNQLEQTMTMQGAAGQLQKYMAALKAAYTAAATIPTAQDRFANTLLVAFGILEQLPAAGAFVATNGNLAASFAATAALYVGMETVRNVLGALQRQQVRKELGASWPLQLRLLEGLE